MWGTAWGERRREGTDAALGALSTVPGRGAPSPGCAAAWQNPATPLLKRNGKGGKRSSASAPVLLQTYGAANSSESSAEESESAAG